MQDWQQWVGSPRQTPLSRLSCPGRGNWRPRSRCRERERGSAPPRWTRWRPRARRRSQTSDRSCTRVSEIESGPSGSSVLEVYRSSHSYYLTSCHPGQTTLLLKKVCFIRGRDFFQSNDSVIFLILNLAVSKVKKCLFRLINHVSWIYLSTAAK